MLLVGLAQYVAPRQHCEGSFSNASVDWRSILSVPDYERVVLTHTCQKTAIRTELQQFDAVHHAFQHSQRLTSLEVPHNNWRFGGALELSA